jgi:hypothetical protein
MRQRRDIGEIISVYFEFFKLNLKNYLNMFITYNGIFIIGFIAVSYLLVTGFVGSLQTNQNASIGNANFDDSVIYFVLGILGFIFLMVITAILNYSLAAAYMVQYEERKTNVIPRQAVWGMVKDNLGNIIVFILLLIMIYVGIFIAGAILSIVPLVGTLAFYLIMLAYTAWMGLSFMVLLQEGKTVTDSLSEGWNLLIKNFWKSVLVNLVIGILVAILLLLVTVVPGVLLGAYSYFTIETGAEIANSPLSKLIWTVGLAVVMVVYCLNQSLQQFINGVLYYSLHEQMYNEHARSQIDKIGSDA